MKITKEYKIGLTIIIVTSLFVWGINYLQGINLFKKYNAYYATFKNVQGLDVSNPVYYNGYQIGIVKDIEFHDTKTGKILVTLSLDNDIKINNALKAIIYTSDLMGTRAIKLAAYHSDKINQPGDTLVTEVEDILADLESFAVPMKVQFDQILNNIDDLLKFLNDSSFKSNLIITTEQLKNATEEVNKHLPETMTKTNNILASIDSVSQTLNSNKDNFNNIVNNLNSISDTLAKTNIAQTINQANATIEKINLLMTQLHNEGNPHELLEKDSLYINLQKATINLDELLKDVKNNPKKYVNFSIF